jgi:hypothetical protein
MSAASSHCDVAAGAEELGAENANTKAFLPQRRRECRGKQKKGENK